MGDGGWSFHYRELSPDSEEDSPPPPPPPPPAPRRPVALKSPPAYGKSRASPTLTKTHSYQPHAFLPPLPALHVVQAGDAPPSHPAPAEEDEQREPEEEEGGFWGAEDDSGSKFVETPFTISRERAAIKRARGDVHDTDPSTSIDTRRGGMKLPPPQRHTPPPPKKPKPNPKSKPNAKPKPIKRVPTPKTVVSKKYTARAAPVRVAPPKRLIVTKQATLDALTGEGSRVAAERERVANAKAAAPTRPAQPALRLAALPPAARPAHLGMDATVRALPPRKMPPRPPTPSYLVPFSPPPVVQCPPTFHVEPKDQDDDDALWAAVGYHAQPQPPPKPAPPSIMPPAVANVGKKRGARGGFVPLQVIRPPKVPSPTSRERSPPPVARYEQVAYTRPPQAQAACSRSGSHVNPARQLLAQFGHQPRQDNPLFSPSPPPDDGQRPYPAYERSPSPSDPIPVNVPERPAYDPEIQAAVDEASGWTTGVAAPEGATGLIEERQGRGGKWSARKTKLSLVPRPSRFGSGIQVRGDISHGTSTVERVATFKLPGLLAQTKRSDQRVPGKVGSAFRPSATWDDFKQEQERDELLGRANSELEEELLIRGRAIRPEASRASAPRASGDLDEWRWGGGGRGGVEMDVGEDADAVARERVEAKREAAIKRLAKVGAPPAPKPKLFNDSAWD